MERANKKGIGCVRKREDTGKYIIDYYDNLGRRHKETVGGNYNDATTILRNKIKEVLGVEGKSLPMEEKALFKKYADGWIEKKVKIKEATKTSYGDIIENHLKPYFGEASIQEIKRENIQDFVGGLIKKKLSSKSINNILLVLHQILDDAVIDKLIAESPYKKIERPRVMREEVDFLQTHEIRLFLDSCLDPKEDPQNHPLFFTAIFTGARRGELLALRWGDIDWVSKKIHIRRSLYKGKLQEPKSEYSKRKIDMGPRLIKILQEHQINQNKIKFSPGETWVDRDLIFCNDRGGFLNADNLYHRDFRRTLKRAGLRLIRIHDLRHTFGSILIAAGHNLKYIQKQMGHAKIEITFNLYGHLLEETFKDAAKKTEGFVFEERPQEETPKPANCPVPVPEKEKGVTTESQPLEMIW